MVVQLYSLAFALIFLFLLIKVFDFVGTCFTHLGTMTSQYFYHDKPSRIALARYPDISLKRASDNYQN